MKIGEGQQQDWHGIAIRMIGLLGAPLILYVLGKLALEYAPSLGLAPAKNKTASP